ncbi:M20/M25/M40 family metallo-hydrolase [Arcobacter porcinus]|uniref:M20/M25/M40 family metallo-hydrolase n=1 Tax=Arcobacter porcinus TaxID=1935204 RepID=UPI0008260DAB|nr:M20/M25/M40 family metallo-hydrolase [Arcobacter porcinus]OCL86584.1 Cytosol non-specific dipeptidase [Arcobacter porcinus]
MSKVLDIFRELVDIPRCSNRHEDFIAYMQNLSKQLNYNCFVDEAKNILCKKDNSNSKIAFQSHYDIVCLSENKKIELIEDEDTISAKDSTLGADNGIGCSYMIALMYENYDGEFLFTSDEEIGLIGANNLNLPINSKYMLNLDSEEEGEICIGCAGGVDIKAIFENKKIVQNIDNLDLYEIRLNSLKGGHSGVDIDKNIPNAIKLLIQSIKECDGKILDISGGERINSIPANAKAIIASKKVPNKTHENMIMEKIDTKSEHLAIYDDKLLNFLYSFENGVRSYNSELGVVQTSINLALIDTKIDNIVVEFSARAMSKEDLKEIKNKTCDELSKNGFEFTSYGKYYPWKPDVNEFTNIVLEAYKKHNKDASLRAIHAGLECAVFKEKFPNLKIASIGPTIKFPHSKNEIVYKKSVDNLYKIVKDIIKSI